MLQFVVLGQIPGTSIQISFGSFLLLSSALAALVFGWLLIHRRYKRRIQQFLSVISTAI